MRMIWLKIEQVVRGPSNTTNTVQPALSWAYGALAGKCLVRGGECGIVLVFTVTQPNGVNDES